MSSLTALYLYDNLSDMTESSRSGLEQKDKKSELEAFKLSPDLRGRFEQEVKKSGLTKSQWIRQAIENYIRPSDDEILVEVDVGHEQKVSAPLSVVARYYARSIERILSDNKELISTILLTFFQSWRQMKISEIRRKKGKGKKNKFQTKSKK